MNRLPRRPLARSRSSAWLTSLALHAALLLLAPGIVYVVSARAPRPPVEIRVAERPEPVPVFEPPAPDEEPRELELETPADPAVVEAEFEPVPLLPLEGAAVAATLTVPFEPNLRSIRFGGASSVAGPTPSGSGGAVASSPPATGDAQPPSAPAAPRPGTAAIAHSTPQPEYPPLSRRRGEQGTVTLRISVDDHGGVAHVELVDSSGFRRLDEAAIAGVRAWRFEPATEASGAPIDSEVLWRVVFELKSA